MIHKAVDSLNQSKVLAGVAILLSSLGGKFLSQELSKSEDNMLQGAIARRVIVFACVFLATRDVLISAIVTLLFMIFVKRGKLFEHETLKTTPQENR